MKVLIIGGTGFIGSVVARQLSANGHEVFLLHRSKGGKTGTCPHIQGDCGNVGDLRKAIGVARPDVVVHMVAYSQGQVAALEDALDGRPMRAVVISSSDVYKGYEVLARLSDAAPLASPFTEASPLRDVLYPYRGRLDADFANDYEKILVERSALQSPVLKTTVLRLGMVYGENDPNRRFAEPLRQMASGAASIEIPKGCADLRMCKCYVGNVACGIVLATEKSQTNNVFNLSDEWVYTELEWLRLLAKKTGWQGEIVTADDKAPGLDARQHFVLDTSRIRESLGYVELFGVDQSLERTIEWELGRLR